MKPVNPKLGIEPLKAGDKRIGSAAFHNQLVKACNAVRRMRVVKGPKNEFIISDENAILSLTNIADNGDGTGFWKWAAVKAYDSGTDYAKDEVVFLDYTNAAAASCPAGLWIALQNVTGGQLPTWPLPDASDPDSASNYWFLIEPITTYTLTADAGSLKKWVIELDAATQDLTIRKLNSDGSRDTAAPLISLNLGDISDLGLTNNIAKLREFTFKDSDTCLAYRAAVLMTEPELVTP